MLAHTIPHMLSGSHLDSHPFFLAYFESAILKLIYQQDRKKPKRAVWVEESQEPENQKFFSAADIRPQMLQLQIEEEKKKTP